MARILTQPGHGARLCVDQVPSLVRTFRGLLAAGFAGADRLPHRVAAPASLQAAGHRRGGSALAGGRVALPPRTIA